MQSNPVRLRISLNCSFLNYAGEDSSGMITQCRRELIVRTSTPPLDRPAHGRIIQHSNIGGTPELLPRIIQFRRTEN
jgi:hypothetical protein